MTNGRTIRSIGRDTTESEVGETAVTGTPEQEFMAEDVAPAWDADFDEPVRERRLWPIVLGTLAMAVLVGWTAFFVWANRDAMAGGAASGQWIGWITQWAVPVLLIAVAWLIAMRSSAREAVRFGDAARMLSQESALLESRLVAVNRELSLAREFLAAQSRELDYLGRSAAERISEHAGKLQALVVDNSAQVDAIAGVSVTALENMAQ
ncbi:MAG: ATPase, partial [Sphingomonadales bacterium]